MSALERKSTTSHWQTDNRRAAEEFAAEWKERGYEKGETHTFWIQLLRRVLGMQDADRRIIFEDQVRLEHTNFIDARIPESGVLIEQKGSHIHLEARARQSDGALLTPLEQAQRYVLGLPLSQHPRYIVVCNFRTFQIYDCEKQQTDYIQLEELPREYHRLGFLINPGKELRQREMQVSLQAGEIVGRLYDALHRQYLEPDSDETLHSLNALCVRLVFCLYAEDAGIFGSRDMFHDYLHAHQSEARRALMDLFRVLNTRPEQRDPYMEADLAAFPYVNGGLFADDGTRTVIPRLTEDIVELILQRASADFDWSEISPTIFGAVFESTLNPETRRSGGMHYTSIENIHKVIDPLFLDGLREELSTIRTEAIERTRMKKLRAFQEKLAGLYFLDPACGSGNFLTETYLSLRRLENEVISLLNRGQGVFALEGDTPVKVSIGQFYGIEVHDFAVTVARTALWIAESQMLRETEVIVRAELDFLPLKSYVGIVEGNALQMDWESVVAKSKLNYIMGNPPFIGARVMSAGQKAELHAIFDGWKNAGNLDYVACWYKKAADMMQGTGIRSALVSTNSITQGEAVAILWKPLMEAGVHIDFAHRTFRWDSEAKIKAHVHCVIAGFSSAPNPACKYIHEGHVRHRVSNINAYLIDAENIFVESRSTPLCQVPTISIGNQPIDDGNYLFSKEDMEVFLQAEPKAAPYFRQWYGAQEFIRRRPRYCLWLGHCPPEELRSMPGCLKRVAAVRAFRAASKRASTRKLADTPTRFQTENMPAGQYIVIPQVSSEHRSYIPMGHMDDRVLCSDKLRLMPDATLYHLGVLVSRVHMSWMRVVSCRLKSDYSYTINLVYNNFPWPEPGTHQKEAIEKTAQEILDARALYPEASLADLYDDVSMPPELRRAHQRNDRAVMAAYGLPAEMEESALVAELMKRYRELAGGSPGSESRA